VDKRRGEDCSSFVFRTNVNALSMTETYPAPIRTDGSNAFARQSMAGRVPRIFEEVIDRNPDYPEGIQDAVQRLADAIVDDAPMTLFDPPAPDYDAWARRFSRHDGETWLGTEWFFAELYAYRRLLTACRYWTTRRDPFQPFKKEEIESEALVQTVGEALAREGPPREQIYRAIMGALWGNRMDLSMKSVVAQGTDASDEHLLVNDIPAAVDDLRSGESGAVHIIMDNAGTEEAFDLALAELFLSVGVARDVTLHVKMTPVLVSDVLGKDVFWLLDVLEERGGRLEQLATRFREFVAEGRLHIVPDVFWNTDARLWEMPDRLREVFQDAALVIAKGDANYRRATNDAIWPSEASWSEAVKAMPAPFLALRTIKSDTLVGVDADTVRRLNRHDEEWRTKGTYGVAQYAA